MQRSKRAARLLGRLSDNAVSDPSNAEVRDKPFSGPLHDLPAAGCGHVLQRLPDTRRGLRDNGDQGRGCHTFIRIKQVREDLFLSCEADRLKKREILILPNDGLREPRQTSDGGGYWLAVCRNEDAVRAEGAHRSKRASDVVRGR